MDSDQNKKEERSKKFGKVLVALAGITKEEEARKDLMDSSVTGYYLEKGFFQKHYDAESLFLFTEDFKNMDALKARILSKNPGCVYNRFEGLSEDSEKEADFAALLENMGIPFTGNPSGALRTCLNKERVKDILGKNGIRVPKGIVVKDPEKIDVSGLSFPLFIKPCGEDASLGIDKGSLVHNKEELKASVAIKLKDFPKGMLVEEFISGNEYSMGFIGDKEYEMLGISMIDYSTYPKFSSFLTYDSKWMVNAPEYNQIIPTFDGIDDKIKEEAMDIAVKTAKILNCRGCFRVDVREKNGDLYVLDVNPNPDITPDSGFMRQARKKGYEYEDIVDKLLLIAQESVKKNEHRRK